MSIGAEPDDWRSFVGAVAGWAAATPDTVAIRSEKCSLSYRELLDTASALARRLRREGVGPEVIVGVCAEPEAELVVGILAIALAGGAWLPLDPTLPARRLDYLIEHAGIATVVTRDAALFAGLNVRSLIPDLAARAAPLPAKGRPLNLAYVLYTSGSTGRPKAVQVTRQALDELVSVKAPRYLAGPGSRVLQFAPASFDASVGELVLALTTGATLVLAARSELVPGHGLIELLRRERISHLLISPSALAALPAATLPDLRVVGSGGEALPSGLARRWAKGRVLLNGYGPTEATVWASVSRIESEISIGEPFPGTEFRLLDARSRPVANGSAGELVIGGAGVARGYLGQPGLTAERFVPDPTRPGGRVYRSGDLATRVGGVYRFVGRVDDQVKLRGFRVEPGEIAEVLREHPNVDQAVVVATAGQLIAYATGAPELDPGAVLAFAAQRLPAYLVPAALVRLTSLPLTPTGKLDRAALPAPERVASGLTAEPAPPRTPTERAVTAIITQLLGTQRVGVDDDLFALGVHSLVLGRLAVRIRDELGADLPMSTVHRARTISALAVAIDRPRPTEAAPSCPPIVPTAPTGTIPLSLPQQRVWFLNRLAPESLAYNTQVTVRLTGELDVEALRATLTEIVRRHEVLRTRFVAIDNVPRQQVLAPMPVRLPVRTATPEHAELIIQAELRKPFDLASPPLARWSLLRHGPTDHTLVQVEHHFVHDGWSFAMLMSEIVRLYPAFAAGRPSPLPEPTLQYRDFARWQRKWMRGDVLEAHLDYWRGLLAGAPQVLEMPTDRPRPARQSFRGNLLRLVIEDGLANRLRDYSRRRHNPLFATMLAGFAALLTRYTGQRDLLVGTGSANRMAPGIESVLGMVVNTLVLRLNTGESPTFTELVTRAQAATAAAYDWPEVPVDELIRAIDPPRDPARNPLFQVMFSFHDSPVPDLEFSGLTGTVTERHNGSAKADLNVVVVPRAAQRIGRAAGDDDGRLTLLWEYATDLFDESTMRRMVDQYLTLLEHAINAPDTPIDELRMGEIPGFVKKPIGTPRLLPELVARHARTRPATLAVLDGQTSLTYAELYHRAKGIATRLGTGPETLVAVCAPRSAGLVVAQLGVLLAGSAFVPIDPDYPDERIRHIAEDSAAPVVLTTGELAPRLPALGWRVVLIDEVAPADDGVLVAPHPNSLAYAIYTSGSTGRPKGVQISHANLANLVAWGVRRRVPGPGDRATLACSPGFDASVWEIWSALGAGASIHVVPDSLRADPRGLVDWLVGNEIQVSFLPTPLAELVMNRSWPVGGALRVLSTGGDRLRSIPGPDTPFAMGNWYGPTETTVICLADDRIDGPVPPVGRPIDGVRASIMRGLRPQPVGVPGELVIGGAGVGRGYLGDPARTAASFVPDPLGAPGDRMYRTGDLCRWRDDGRIDYLGRVDRQVKIRGFRVEPGEVEAVLREHPGVTDAVVTVAGSGADLRLVAYPAGTANVAALREFLADRLPPYLRPSVIVPIAELPIGTHGKVDLAALPAPEPVASTAEAVRASTPTQRRLAVIWRRLLNLDEVDVSANFFALGGHSLLVVRLLGEVRDELGVEVPIADFFAQPTVSALAVLVDDPARAIPEQPSELVGVLSEAELNAMLAVLPSEGE